MSDAVIVNSYGGGSAVAVFFSPDVMMPLYHYDPSSGFAWYKRSQVLSSSILMQGYLAQKKKHPPRTLQ